MVAVSVVLQVLEKLTLSLEQAGQVAGEWLVFPDPERPVGEECRLVSSDIRNPAGGDIENPATLVTLMLRPAPVRWWI